MVQARAAASEEIEQTLRLARDRVEAQIARYRLWMFACIFATTLVVEAVNAARRHEHTVVPSVYFAGGAAYALLVRRLVARHGARDALVYTSLVLDILAASSVFLVMQQVSGGASVALNHVFTGTLTAPSLLLVLLINLLRANRGASIAGAVVAAVVGPSVMALVNGFHVVLIPLVMGTALTGLIGVAAAQQSRATLDSFARLSLLRRYLPPAAVERVMREHPDAAMALGGRLATVTLLAADLRGFTAMSERLSPDEVVRQLNAYHGVMLEQVERHGGVLDKFIGDGTLVIFGLRSLEVAARRGSGDEVADDAGAAAAVACARDMLLALRAHNAARAAEGAGALKMGIGVHTGSVVVGNIGAVGRRLEFTVIGDAVNTASRLEGLTKEAGAAALFSSATATRAVADGRTPVLRELPAMRARGKEELLTVFALSDEPAVSA